MRPFVETVRLLSKPPVCSFGENAQRLAQKSCCRHVPTFHNPSLVTTSYTHTACSVRLFFTQQLCAAAALPILRDSLLPRAVPSLLSLHAQRQWRIQQVGISSPQHGWAIEYAMHAQQTAAQPPVSDHSTPIRACKIQAHVDCYMDEVVTHWNLPVLRYAVTHILCQLRALPTLSPGAHGPACRPRGCAPQPGAAGRCPARRRCRRHPFRATACP